MGRSEPAVPNDGAPHDLALLTRLAGEFLRQVPGGAGALSSAASLPPSGTGIAPGGVPLGAFGATAPASPLPVQAPVGAGPDDASLRALLAPPAAPKPPASGLPQSGFPAVGADPQAPQFYCAQPILRRFGLEATVRPSFAFYNTFADIDALAASVRKLAK